MNKRQETIAFILLIACLCLTTVSLTMLSGTVSIVANLIGVVLGILSGGFYGLSVRK